MVLFYTKYEILYMNKITPHLPQSQQLNKNNNLQVEPWVNDPNYFFSRKRKRGLKNLVNYLGGLSNLNPDVYPTQDAIAREIDITREQVNRLAAYAESLGILTKLYRQSTSCVYRLAPIFNNVSFRQKIMHLMPSFWYLPLLLIAGIVLGTSSSKALTNSKDITQYIKGIGL